MNTGDYNDDIWDEHQWEAHLVKIESMGRLNKFLAPEPPGSKPRWLSILQESNDELEAVDAFIEEELFFEDPYFGEEDEDEWEEDSDDSDDYDDDLYSLDDEDFDEGEDWKELSDDFTMSDYGSIDKLEVYNDARQLGADILQWIETVNPKSLDVKYYDFVNNTLKIGAKITGGYNFGFEPDFLGANIVYTKRALYCANDALTILQRDLKGGHLLQGNQYYRFHRQLFELRNAIGIYIQELREQFYRYR